MKVRYTPWLLGLFCLLLALPAVAQQAPRAEDPEPTTHLFQIVVVVGSKEMSKPASDVPANARQALDDISQFLPYKHYRMVDTALIRSAGEGRGLMSGPANQDYNVNLRYYTKDRGKIFVRQFQLADTSRQGNPVLIDTSFEVDLGETIVVGSSKLDGDSEALIVLFTAIQ